MRGRGSARMSGRRAAGGRRRGCGTRLRRAGRGAMRTVAQAGGRGRGGTEVGPCRRPLQTSVDCQLGGGGTVDVKGMTCEEGPTIEMKYPSLQALQPRHPANHTVMQSDERDCGGQIVLLAFRLKLFLAIVYVLALTGSFGGLQVIESLKRFPL
mmetsp:Transcript_14768/g.40387  ORF Transcript_14768/g.40387 Transcript_14768/m.40387 type:complete len:154 (-) Transcript_14768:355-816(-)